MTIKAYETSGGKNLIIEYIEQLPDPEKITAYEIISEIEADGAVALKALNTRQLRGKLWEIKFSNNRIIYVVYDKDLIYFLHACQKQKGKAEKHDLELAISRAKRYRLKI